MKNNKNKKFYIIYKFDKEKNDLININDFDKKKDACKFLNISELNATKYTCKNIDNINCKLKDNQYFIYADFEN